MIYAIRTQGSRETLIECAKKKEFEAVVYLGQQIGSAFRRVRGGDAHVWVRSGKEHETGLFVQNGKIKYARAEV